MNSATFWLVNRLREPSTWNGFAVFVAGLSFLPHAVEISAMVPAIGVIVGGILGMAMSEKSSG